MLSSSRSLSMIRRLFTTTVKEAKSAPDVSKTTVDAGKALEDRVARMLKKRGHICIKQNQRVKDSYGNWSEFDIVYGWPIKHYVECKNYSHPVKLEMVAKFKEVLRLHHIPKSRGMFVTTSTYTPRATTIGILCIDGKGLERLEKTAATASIIKSLIFVICGGGSYFLYNYLTTSQSEKVVQWRDSLDNKTRETAEKTTQAVKETAVEVLESAEVVMEQTKESVVESAKDIVEGIKTSIPLPTSSEKEMGEGQEKLVDQTEEEWEAPSLYDIVYTIFWGLLGYSVKKD